MPHTTTNDEVPLGQRVFLLLGASIWIGLTGVLDYASGFEVRLYPLYFLPICLVGWRLGPGITLFAAWLSATTWLVSNYEAGLHYSNLSIWVVNTLMQGLSFSAVGILMVFSRRSYRLAEGRSRTDALTGLLNGRAFTDEGVRVAALCERHKRPLTVAYLDIDDFKKVNDGFGHAQGDAVLAKVGTALHAASRETDIVARLGGDEFGMLLAETDEVGAGVVLARLRALLDQALADAPARVTMSIGAVTSHGTHPAIGDLLKSADKLLYDAKATGKDRFIVGTVDSAASVPSHP